MEGLLTTKRAIPRVGLVSTGVVMRRSGHVKPTRAPLSALVETKLVDTLFDQYGSIIVGQLGIVSTALLAYAENRSPWLLAWALGLLAILPPRLLLARAYWRRDPADPPSLWVARFAVGAGLTSLSYGMASAAAVLQSDSFLKIVIITTQCAYVTIATVRNNAVPRAAAVQGFVPLVCLGVACVATGDRYYMVFSLMVVLQIICVFQIIQFLSQKTRDLLVAQECATAANAQLEKLATTDPLTGAVNRRGFDAAVARTVAHAIRHNEDMSLLILDIDHFKVLNDSYGHQAGDEYLRAVARCLRDAVRPDDLVSRHGGEEFAILLPCTDARGAATIAERVRLAIRNLSLKHPSSPSGTTTVSVGYATMERGDTDVADLMKQADSALYRAKDGGRDRIAGCLKVDGTSASAQLETSQFATI